MENVDSGGQGPETTDTAPGTGEGEGVQPTSSTEGGGQGFLEPYLQDIPEEQRELVTPILEKYRQDQDAQVTRRFEQLQEEAKIPTTIYQSLLEDPVGTVTWITERMQEERGLNIRDALLQQWGVNEVENNPGQGEGVQSGEESADKPLTQADVDRILQERETQRAQEQQQQQYQQQQFQQQQKTINGWVDSAVKNHGLKLDDTQGDDPVRAVIIMQANTLHEQGIAKGQAAIEMAAEAVAKRFSIPKGTDASTKGPQPRVAQGGSPPPAKTINVTDGKERRARMEELFTSGNVQ